MRRQCWGAGLYKAPIWQPLQVRFGPRRVDAAQVGAGTAHRGRCGTIGGVDEALVVGVLRAKFGGPMTYRWMEISVWGRCGTSGGEKGK